MRFLVVGASGMVGHLIAVYLEEKGHDVVGISRRPAPVENWFECDVNDVSLLRGLIEGFKPDVIVNAAGLLVAECEANPDKAVFVNAYLPRYLAKMAEEVGGRLIQLSTDCVFQGNTGPYTEETIPDGKKLYARTKALGEIDDARNLTLRNSVVGPDIDPEGIGLLNWFMKQRGSIDGWKAAIWTGLTTLELAKVIEAAAIDRSASGLVNMVPTCPPICKHDLLQLFNDAFRRGGAAIEGSDWFVSDKALTRTNFAFHYDVPDYMTMVEEMAVWVRLHPGLYPSYYYDAERTDEE